MSAAPYFGQKEWQAGLQSLLPMGRAWTRAPEANLTKLLAAWAEEFARVEARIVQLQDEMHPATALELLPQWEAELGLPDACVPVTGSVRERQMAVAAKHGAIGAMNKAYFISLAGTLGFAIEVDEFAPCRVGARVGSRVQSTDWAYAWRVNIVEEAGESDYSSAWLRAGSRCNERLRSFGSGQLECLIRRDSPGHTTVFFAYTEQPEPLLWFDFTKP